MPFYCIGAIEKDCYNTDLGCDDCEFGTCEDCGENRRVFPYIHRGYEYQFCLDCIIKRKNHPKGLNPKLHSLEEIMTAN